MSRSRQKRYFLPIAGPRGKGQKDWKQLCNRAFRRVSRKMVTFCDKEPLIFRNESINIYSFPEDGYHLYVPRYMRGRAWVVKGMRK